MRIRSVLLLIALTAPGVTFADPPNDLSYQGLLRDSVGEPLAGPVNLEIGIWDTATSGTALYRESHTGVTLQSGVFHLLVGTGAVLEGTLDVNTFSGPDRYIEVTVNGETLTPRQAISSAPFALRAAGAGILPPTQVAGPSVAVGVLNSATGLAVCPAGTFVTGGGFLSGTNAFRTRESYPVDATTWSVEVYNTSASAKSFTPYAVCVPGAP